MEYVGSEKAISLVLQALEDYSTEEEIISLATIRNIDRVYAKLQKKYYVFQVKVPLYSVNPPTAKIREQRQNNSKQKENIGQSLQCK